MDATIEQLYETFKSFGAIRKDGIQVRSYPVSYSFNDLQKNYLQSLKNLITGSITRLKICEFSGKKELYWVCGIRKW